MRREQRSLLQSRLPRHSARSQTVCPSSQCRLQAPTLVACHRIQVDDLRLPVSRFMTRVILVLFIMTAKHVEQFSVASFSCCALWLPEDCLACCYGHVNFVGVFCFAGCSFYCMEICWKFL